MRLLLVASFILAASVVAAEENRPVSSPEETARRQFLQGNFDAALAAVNEAETRGEPSAEMLDLKGCIYAEQQKTDEAIAAFDAAYTLKPNGLSRLHLADMFLRQKRWEEARAMYGAAMKETSVLIANERLRYGVFIAALQLNDEEAARTAFENLPFPTESAAYYYGQAAWAFAHGSKKDAEKWLRRAEEIYPMKARAWFARPLFELGWIKDKPPLVAD